MCVKQVPDTANVEVDPVTGVLKRDGAQSKLNPYDLYAMESSLGMKERRMGEYDLILCGKQTTDGDTARVGPEVAQWLGIPHASNVLEIRETGPGWIRVRMNMDGYEQIQAMDLPCLITMDMELSCTTLTQIAVMFVIITAGILCSRFGVILEAAWL